MVDTLIHSQLYLYFCILICLLTTALAEMYTPVTHILPELEKRKKVKSYSCKSFNERKVVVTVLNIAWDLY